MKAAANTQSQLDFTQPLAEPATREYLDTLNSGGDPPMETLTPTEARGLLEAGQNSLDVELAPASVEQLTLESAAGPVKLYIVRPEGATGTLPAFLFMHGGGWVLGDFPTHERLVRELVAYSGAAAVFLEYDRSPEVQFPTALDQGFAALTWLGEHGQEMGLDPNRLAVVGNSAGGNMATVLALRALRKGGPKLRMQLLLWPVTDANFETPSYRQFGEGYALTKGMMQWFWDAYLPEQAQRENIYASPLRATLEELTGMPPTLIQTAELDVLRDEGEAYARKLAAAGVPVTHVRLGGMIHDCSLLNVLAHLPAVQSSLRQAGEALGRHLA